MSRDDGFANADVDVDLLEDAKLRRLIRSNRDEATVARAIVAYISVVLGSWKAGARVALADAVPLWITDPDNLTAKLHEVGLVDADGRIVEHAWSSWFGPAAQRRDDRRIEGAVNGLVGHGTPRKEAEALVRDKVARGDLKLTLRVPRGDVDPSVPSVPSLPSVPSGHTRPYTTEHAKTTATDSIASGDHDRRGKPSGEPSPKGRNDQEGTPAVCRDCGRPTSVHAPTCPIRVNPALSNLVVS